MVLRNKMIGNQKLMLSLIESAKSSRLASLVIFAGPNGVGKKLAALALSQELICPKGPPACGECGPCRRISEQKSESVLLVEPESTTAQIKLEQSRQIAQFVQLRQLGRARTIIIDQAHRLNPQSSNALLKLFEEPPQNTYIFLITQSPNALLATIRSRAQLFRFSPLTDDQIRSLVGVDDWILKMARGQMDVAFRLKEDSKTWTESKMQALNFITQTLSGEGDLFSKMKDAAGDREKSLQNILFWQSLFRDALVAGLAPNSEQSWISDGAERLVRDLAGISSEELLQMSSYLLEMEQDLNANVDRTLLLENFYFKMISLKSERI